MGGAIPVIVRLDIRVGELHNVRMAQTRKGGEEKHVSYPHLTFMTKRCGHLALQLLFEKGSVPVFSLPVVSAVAVEAVVGVAELEGQREGRDAGQEQRDADPRR